MPVGSLNVELGINAASFIDGLSKATIKMRSFGADVQKTFSGLSNSIGAMAGSFGAFGPVGMAVSQGLMRMGEAAGWAMKETAGMSPILGVFASAAAGMVAGAVAAEGALIGLAIQGSEIVHRFDLMSQKTGMSTATLQTFEAMGKVTGMSLEMLTKAMQKFDRAISGQGSKVAQSTLKELGVTSHDSKEALLQLADAFSKMEDGTTKVADATAIFGGRMGIQLIPFLNKGREGVAEFSEIVKEFGPVIGEQAKKNTEDWEKATLKLSLAFDSFKVSLSDTVGLLSKFVEATAVATKAFGDFVSEVAQHPIEAAKAFGKGAVAQIGRASALEKGMAVPTLGLSLLGAGIGGGIAGVSTAADRKREAMAAAVKPEKAEDKAVEALREKYQTLYDIEKDGGEAAYALEEKKKDITAAVTAGKMKEAYELQKQIPLLEAAAALEKEREPKVLRKREEGVTLEFAKKGREAQDQLALASALGESSAAIDVQAYREKAAAIVAEMRARAVDSEGNAIKELTDRIDAAAPAYERLAVVSDIAAKVREFGQAQQKAAEDAAEQTTALGRMFNAYAKGGDAIDEAAVDESLAKETVALRRLQDEFDLATQADGEFAESTIRLQTALDLAALKLGKRRDEEERKKAATTAGKAVQQVYAAGPGGLEKQLADIRSVRDAYLKAGGDEQTIDLVIGNLENELYKRRRANAFDLANIETKAASDRLQLEIAEYKQHAEYAFNAANADKILAQEKFNDALKYANQQFELDNQTLLNKAKAYDQQKAQSAQWDEAAMKVGSFGQRTAAVFDEIRANGEDMWGSFARTAVKAVDDVSTNLAHLVVTGKSNFREMGLGLAESLTKSVVQKGMSAMAGGILGSTGLGGMLGGAMGGKPDGTQGNPMHVVMNDMNELLGGLSGGKEGEGGGFGGLGKMITGLGKGIGGVFKSIGGLFGGFLAGGGDVTPGKAYIVGERHPEFFVPRQPGTVATSLKTGGAQTNVVNVNFHGVTDADTFKANRTQIMNGISMAVGRAGGRR